MSRQIRVQENSVPIDVFRNFFDNLVNHGLEYFRRYYGFYRGTCVDVEDPEEQGRILVRVPVVTWGNTNPMWAWPIMPWGGRDSGMFVVPDVDDPVYVVFENGDANRPMYLGGYWPKVDGSDNYAEGLGAYTSGKPTKRIFKTKAGHELSFEDDPENLSTKLVWHDPDGDKYSFLAFTKEGNVQFANHKGCFMELRAIDDDELVMIMDKTGNLFSMDKDGIKMADQEGNVVSTGQSGVQVLSGSTVALNAPAINAQTAGMAVASTPASAINEAVRGTAFMTWWNTVFLPWLNTHVHPTGVGPSGPPSVLHVAPADSLVLTDKIKME